MAYNNYYRRGGRWNYPRDISSNGGYYSRSARRPQGVKFGTSKDGKPYVSGFCYKQGKFLTFVGSPSLKHTHIYKNQSGSKSYRLWVIKVTDRSSMTTTLCNGFYNDSGSPYVFIPDYEILLSGKGSGSVVLSARSKKR